jgi:hypothetical protein
MMAPCLENFNMGGFMTRSNRYFFLGAVILAIGCFSISQADPWKNSLNIGLNLTQNAYSDSWVGGDVGSLAWVATANGIFEKQMGSKFNYRKTTQLQFGQTHTQDKDTKKWRRPLKSADQIDIENLGRFTLQAFVDPFVAFAIRSQFLDASVTSVPRILNPLYLTESAGIAKSLYARDKNQLITRLGFALKENITRNVTDTLAKTTKSQTTTDGGIQSVTDTQLNLAKNLSYIGRLSLFKALFFSKANELKGTPQANYWKVVTVNFESTLSAGVSKYMTVLFYTQFLYDKTITLRGRFKQTLGLGLTYKML